ncbi:MAG: hypothetical protein Kow0098_07500 [Ignavibacteriaceae bacterium]
MRKKKKSQIKNGNKNRQLFSFSGEKLGQITGVFYLLISVLIFLSILSFDRRDEPSLNYLFNDLIASFSNHSDVYNWMGVTGAHLSLFLVKTALGYFSLVLPVLIFIWGINQFKNLEKRLLLHITNFLLISAILISSFFGVLRTRYEIFKDFYELSGGIGEFLGEGLGGVAGGFGALLLLIALQTALLIYAFDINIGSAFRFIRNFATGIFSRSSKPSVKINRKIDEKTDSNLAKLKKLKNGKKQSEELPLTAGELMQQEAETQTQIRIIRKDELPDKKEENPVLKEESKHVDMEKVGQKPERNPDIERSEKLPEPWEEKIDYKKPSLDLLELSESEDFSVAEEELKRNAELLKEKLSRFDIEIKDISVTPGPVVTLYEIVPAPGVKISRIVSLENDIALALAAQGIRIIAPIPGKGAIGVEIPNAKANIVKARSVLGKINESKYQLPIALGKTISGDVYIADLSQMPHVLIAGSTGSGKSVGINMIISSLLYSKNPSDVKLAMIDPKKIELSLYNKLRRHYLAVCPDLEEEIVTTPQNAVLLLKSVEYEMEKRYDKLAKLAVRNIVDYNKKVEGIAGKVQEPGQFKHHHLPYIIVIVDELADLMITAGKEVEEPITRLAQLARAVGIHLVLATQRPSVDVITGVIKANFSARIAYQVASKIDSRTILDMNGAEQLLGKGDMLFLPTGQPKPIRIQNAFISTEEVEKLTNYVYSQPAFSKPYFLPSLYEKKKAAGSDPLSDRDEMFDDAARIIVRTQQGSVSMLQRRLKLGYSRAARIVDQLEQAGIVGASDGSKARAVLVEDEETLETILRSL